MDTCGFVHAALVKKPGNANRHLPNRGEMWETADAVAEEAIARLSDRIQGDSEGRRKPERRVKVTKE